MVQNDDVNNDNDVNIMCNTFYWYPRQYHLWDTQIAITSNEMRTLYNIQDIEEVRRQEPDITYQYDSSHQQQSLPYHDQSNMVSRKSMRTDNGKTICVQIFIDEALHNVLQYIEYIVPRYNVRIHRNDMEFIRTVHVIRKLLQMDKIILIDSQYTLSPMCSSKSEHCAILCTICKVYNVYMYENICNRFSLYPKTTDRSRNDYSHERFDPYKVDSHRRQRYHYQRQQQQQQQQHEYEEETQRYSQNVKPISTKKVAVNNTSTTEPIIIPTTMVTMTTPSKIVCSLPLSSSPFINNIKVKKDSEQERIRNKNVTSTVVYKCDEKNNKVDKNNNIQLYASEKTSDKPSKYERRFSSSSSSSSSNSSSNSSSSGSSNNSSKSRRRSQKSRK